MSKFDPIESLAQMRHEFGEHGGVNVSVEASTTFTVMDAETMPDIFNGRRGPEESGGGCFLYSRHFNPTVYNLGRQVAAFEGAEAGYCTASGMGAISATLTQLCDHGDHVVSSDTVYGGTFALLKEYLPAKAGLDVSFVDMTDLEAVDAAFTPRTRLLYVESISNPTLRVADIPELAKIAHAHGAQLVVDNTFAPLIVAPLQHGADIVVHSLTKFVNGASDIIAGAICGRTEFLSRLMDLHTGSVMLLGPTLDPRSAFNISMRIPHLGLRMAEHSKRAMIMASRLREADIPVIYPGLGEHPDHAVLRRLHNPNFGFGGLFAVDLGTVRRANEFMEILQNKDRFGFMAVSLGYFETLMSCSGSTTSSELSDDDKQTAGILPGLVRIAIGYTGSVEQRWRQLEDALGLLDLLPSRPA